MKNTILYALGAIIVGSEKVVNTVKKVKKLPNIKNEAKSFYHNLNNKAVDQYNLKDTVKKQKEELKDLKRKYTDMLTHNEVIEAEVE
tara:strand:+ start:385 stop:645 length:261 start_codon:yes stop_codon:yes gene_type:complete